MILILDLDLGVLKMYLHTKNEVSRSRHFKVRARTGHIDTLFAPVTLTLTG